MRITRHGHHAQVAFAAEVSGVAALPCAVDVSYLTVGLEAVNTPSSGGPQAADSQFKRRARPGPESLDIAKNLLRWRVKNCVNLPRKTGSWESAYRPLRTRVGRSVHGCHGVGREAGPVHADHAPRTPRPGGICCRGVWSRGSAVRSGWVPINGRDSMYGDPSGENMASLFENVRSEQNVFSAWRHVKKSAMSSANGDIRGAATEFEHSHQRHIRRIITQLREGRFKFDPVTGVLKDAKKRIAVGKDPRPIAIATLKNRIVQRAILQILQPRTAIDSKDVNTRYRIERDERLGAINEVNKSKYGVGGLMHPYGGVEPAIRLIREAIDGGSKYFYQSDIKSFFTRIPTKTVVEFVRTQTQDDALSDLFEYALALHLDNEEELQSYASLFPKGGIGVAQGSSLSAFAGNVLLYDLDHELNKMGVTAVRYIDDILMVGEDKKVLDAAISHAGETLESFGFGLYAPAKGSDKAASGECSNAINFLGCTIQPRRCVPSTASTERLKTDVTKAISESKIAIQAFLKKGNSFHPKNSKTATLDAIGKRIYGWQKAFAFCTDAQPFEQLDRYIDRQISDYESALLRMLVGASTPTRTKVLGIPSTHEMFLNNVRKRT